ncbi:MAG: substrate-binding domain-containing protein [Prochlorotrichaceae cyanobacterium]
MPSSFLQKLLLSSAGLSFGLSLGMVTPFSDPLALSYSPDPDQAFIAPLPSPALIAQQNLQELAPYTGSVSVIYNLKDSGVDLKLSAQTLAEIFQGELTNWQQVHVRFPQEEIRVVTFADSSLSNLIFTRYLNHVTDGAIEASWQPSWDIPLLYAKVDREGEIAGVVDRTPGAIGFVPSVIAEYYDMPTARIQDLDGQYLDRIN